MRRYLIIALLVTMYIELCSGQFGEIECLHIAGGPAFPIAPRQFYDYWKPGFQLSIGAELANPLTINGGYSERTKLIQFIDFETSYFAFDQARFFKQIGINEQSDIIRGASTYNFTLAYNIKCFLPDLRKERIAVLVGLGCSYIIKSEGHVDYPHYPVTQSSVHTIVASIPLRLTMGLFEWRDQTIDLNIFYILSVINKQEANSDFISIQIDYSFAP